MTGVMWYLIAVFICISLVTGDVDYLFMCYLATYMSSFKKHLFRTSAQFMIRFFVFLFCLVLFWYLVAEAVCIFWRSIYFLRLFTWKYFFPFWRLSSCLLMVSFAIQNLLGLFESQLFIFVFIFITIGQKKDLAVIHVKGVCSMFPSKSCIVSGLIFRSFIHLSLFLCKVLESVLISFTCSFLIVSA